MMHSFKNSLLYSIILIFVGSSIYFTLNMLVAVDPLRVTTQNAGILPWAFHDNTVWIMVGKEYRHRAGWVWTDFGGKCDTNKKTCKRETIAECAGREGSEEIRELYKPTVFAQKITENPIVITNNYAQCFPEIEWIPQEDLNALSQKKIGTYKEKVAFKWIKARELLRAVAEAQKSSANPWFYHVYIGDSRRYDNTTEQSNLLYWNLAKTLGMPKVQSIIKKLLEREKHDRT